MDLRLLTITPTAFGSNPSSMRERVNPFESVDSPKKDFTMVRWNVLNQNEWSHSKVVVSVLRQRDHVSDALEVRDLCETSRTAMELVTPATQYSGTVHCDLAYSRAPCSVLRAPCSVQQRSNDPGLNLGLLGRLAENR